MCIILWTAFKLEKYHILIHKGGIVAELINIKKKSFAKLNLQDSWLTFISGDVHLAQWVAGNFNKPKPIPFL